MNVPQLDSRVHAFNPDARLAEDRLRGRLDGDGWQFVAPQPAWVRAARLSLRKTPDWSAPQVSEALPGEALVTLWEHGEWSFVRTLHDAYLGWARTAGLTRHAPEGEVLIVQALRAHAYAGPKVSQPICAELCLGTHLTRASVEIVVENARRWVPVNLPGQEEPAYVQEVIIQPTPTTDVVDLALRFLGTPYVWGGRSAWGLDCSGLTQLVYGAFGRALPRDTDQQEEALEAVDQPQRGDLAFFPGHVGLMLDDRRMVHANATHISVTIEVLGKGDYGARLLESVSSYRRWRA